MLQRIRDNSSGPIAYVIVGLITLVFGVWGIGSYFTPSSNPAVAQVGDAKITKYQLKRAYEQRYRRLRKMMGDNFDPDMIDPQQLHRSVLRRLVRTAMLQQYAVNAGYRTTDAALLQALKSDPRFQVDGQFSEKRYRTLLANSGLQPAAFEARMRRNMVSQQVRAGLARSAFAASPGVTHAYSLRHQKRKVAYLVFPASAYRAHVEVTTKEIKQWYQEHTEQFMRPDRVKLSYVALDRSALNASQAVTREAMHTLYKKRKARFSTPDKRDARQVFVPVEPSNAAKARKKIQTIASKLSQGKTFDAIAADSQSAVQVEKVSDVTGNELPADVAEALFSLEVGKVSSPIRGDKGWYLVKPTAVHPGQTKPFDEVQKQLKDMLRTQWRNKHFSQQSERMEALAYQAPNSLKVIAKELGLDIKTTGWITRDQGEGIGQYSAVREAAYSDAVLKDHLNSTVIRIGEGRQIVLRVKEHQPPQEIPLKQVKDRIRKQLVGHQAQQRAKEAAKTARGKLESGTSLTQIASKTPAKLKQPGYLGRTATGVPTQIRDKAFALSLPETGEMTYGITQAGENNVALVALRDVKTGNAEGVDVPQKFLQRQRSYVAQLEYAAFIDYLNAHADIELMKDKLDFQ